MSLRDRRKIQAKRYKEAINRPRWCPPNIAEARDIADKNIRSKYSLEIARITSSIMEHCDNAADSARDNICITVALSGVISQNSFLDMWNIILDDLRKAEYSIDRGEADGVLFIDDVEITTRKRLDGCRVISYRIGFR
jgi:hypothetical protein